MSTYVYRNLAEVGVLARKAFVANIKNLCFLHGLELKLEEDRGLLSSNFRFEISGDESKVIAVVDVIVEWIEEL